MKTKVIHQPDSLNEVLELLKANKLPHQDIELSKSHMVSYHDDTGKLIGSGGLEFYYNCALLRSVAVDETERGMSYGKQIVNDLLNRARDKSIMEVYLLTETAQAFFLKRGFADVPRESVPNSIKETTEFKTVCPVSAVCMVYQF